MSSEKCQLHVSQGHSPEMVVDGRTLSRILGTEHESLLAQLAYACSGVVVCRASPSQKATIVRMMKRFQTAQLSGMVGTLHHLYRDCMGCECRGHCAVWQSSAWQRVLKHRLSNSISASGVPLMLRGCQCALAGTPFA